MGLLPTYQSDWLEFQEPQKVKCDELFDWFSKPVSPQMLEISGSGMT